MPVVGSTALSILLKGGGRGLLLSFSGYALMKSGRPGGSRKFSGRGPSWRRCLVFGLGFGGISELRMRGAEALPRQPGTWSSGTDLRMEGV